MGQYYPVFAKIIAVYVYNYTNTFNNAKILLDMSISATFLIEIYACPCLLV